MRLFLDLQGAAVTDRELSDMAERYPRCGGEDHWGVREYARPGARGAREYRVVRGRGVQEVYRSAERPSADAVRTALNDLEARDAAFVRSIGLLDGQ